MSTILIGLILSFLITLLIGKESINYLRKFQGAGQPIRNDGPESHLKKIGTPTMGGLLILVVTTIVTLFLCKFHSVALILLFVMISYGFIGFIDDYRKVKKQTTNGFPAKLRLLLEFVISGIVIYLIQTHIHCDTSIRIPFTAFDIGWLYYPLASIVIVGTANSTNLTDGLDGLLIGMVMMVLSCFLIVCYFCMNGIYEAGRFGFDIHDMEILMIFCGVLIGVSIGFLWYNANPAMVFMGDVGSLSLGGVIGTIALMLKQEIFLLILGGIFVIEALSVIIQVLSYKIRKKRVFLMAPIHHHFEKLGISENKVVMRFWIVQLLLCFISMSLTML